MNNAIVKLYGTITDWNSNSANELVARIEAAAIAADVVELHIHSFGGQVMEGNVICNAIKGCKKPIHAYVDGVAASMAAIIALSAHKLYMSENALLMVHAPAGQSTGRGTLDEHKQTIKLLTAFEKNFVKILMSRSGKDEAEVRTWLGGETWFSSEDALTDGLIDGIVDPIAKSVILTGSETSLGIEAIYNRYTAELALSQINNNQTKLKMDKEKLIKTLGLVGVTAQSSDMEIEAAIEAKAKADKEALDKANADVKAQSEARIMAAIDPYKDKMTVEQRTHFEAIGRQCGIEALTSALAPLASHRTITEQIAGNTTGTAAATATASWSFDEWQQKNPAGLEKLSRENYDAFNALYSAKYGVKAPR